MYAPAYDASQDMDPDDAPVVAPVRDDVKSLAYYQDLERQRSFKLRMTLIALVCVMMIAIMWMVRDNRNSMLESTAQLNERLNSATNDKMVLVDVLLEHDFAAQFSEISARLEAIEKGMGIDPK